MHLVRVVSLANPQVATGLNEDLPWDSYSVLPPAKPAQCNGRRGRDNDGGSYMQSPDILVFVGCVLLSHFFLVWPHSELGSELSGSLSKGWGGKRG